MVNVEGTRISISRGDTAAVTLQFDGQALPEGAVALVTLKRRKGDASALWEKRLTISDGKAMLVLSSADTDLEPGDYWWDARLLYQSSVVTPLPPQILSVLEVVGDV